MLSQLRFTVATAVKANSPITIRFPIQSLVNLTVSKLLQLYTLLVITIWAIGLFTGDQWKIVALYRNMLPFAFVPVLFFIISIMMNRQWILVFCMLPIVWGFSSEYLFTFMNTLPPITGENSFTILTYNTYGIERDLSDTIRLIYDADTDIVAMQEMSVESAELFASLLLGEYPYQALHPQPDMILGHGVLSRYPIIEDRLFYVNERPSFQRVVISIDHRPVTLFNVHTKPPSVGFGFQINVEPRETIINELRTVALQEINPVVLAGDFNMTQSSDDYYRMVRDFTDLHRHAGRGLGLTYPASRHDNFLSNFTTPLSRIDYIFYSDRIQGLRTRVWSSSGGSDHRPVWGLLSFAA